MFGKQSVANITASLLTMVEKLDAHAQAMSDESELIDTKIFSLKQDQTVVYNEMSEAVVFAKNIRNLGKK